jgi:integrase
MIRKRAAAAGNAEEIRCHTFRATGITAYLANGGALEHTQEMATHESPALRRTCGLEGLDEGIGHAVIRHDDSGAAGVRPVSSGIGL